jgi:hypothetical protein
MIGRKFPPGSFDRRSIPAPVVASRGKKNRLVVSYECRVLVQAYATYVGVGDRLPVMSLFLETDGCVEIPLEATYGKAFAEVPKRWRDELV